MLNDGIVSKRGSSPTQNLTVPEVLTFVFMRIPDRGNLREKFVLAQGMQSVAVGKALFREKEAAEIPPQEARSDIEPAYRPQGLASLLLTFLS